VEASRGGGELQRETFDRKRGQGVWRFELAGDLRRDQQASPVALESDVLVRRALDDYEACARPAEGVHVRLFRRHRDHRALARGPEHARERLVYRALRDHGDATVWVAVSWQTPVGSEGDIADAEAAGVQRRVARRARRDRNRAFVSRDRRRHASV